MYVVAGVTGNTGSVVAKQLLALGKKVRGIGRTEQRLQPFVQKGGEPFVADLTDKDALAEAFAGAEGVYVMIDLLGDYGVEHRNITVVVPGHEAQRSPQVLTGGYADVELVTISPQETYAHRLLAGHTLKPLLEQFLSRALRANLQFVDDQQTTAINQRLESHLQDDFQVHIKRVYAFKTPETGDNVRKVLVKGVGWGWLGYHEKDCRYSGTGACGYVHHCPCPPQLPPPCNLSRVRP